MKSRVSWILAIAFLGWMVSVPSARAQSTQNAPATPDATSSDKNSPAPDQGKDSSPAVQDQKKDSATDKKGEHHGGKNDVDAIGNRDIGNRGLGNWYSIESEVRLGKQYAQQVEQSVKLVSDPVVNEYVNRIGQNLVRNSDAKVPFTIKVVDSDEINAFALPGGFFYV